MNFVIKSAEEQKVEARFGKPIQDTLRDLYVDRRLTQQEIADSLGVHRVTIVSWLAKHGISRSDRTPPTEIAS